MAWRAQQPVYPLHRGQGRCRTGSHGKKDQGGGERPWIAAAVGRIIGVQLNQPGYLLFGVRISGRNVSTRRPIRATASRQIGSPWRKLNPGRRALLVLACLRKGETFAELAAGFGIDTAAAWGTLQPGSCPAPRPRRARQCPAQELADLAEAPLPLARRATGQSHLRPSDPRNRRMHNVQGSMTVPTLDNLRIAVIATDGAGEPKLAEPVRALREAGARTELLSIRPDQIQAVRHDLQPTQTFAAGKTLDQADPEDYDARLLPGGAVNADQLCTEPAVPSFLQQVNGAGRPMAVICHAPWGLVPSGMARGRTLTSYHAIQDELRNAGATWVDLEVVVPGTLVTSRQPGAIPAFTPETLHLFAAARGA